MKKPAALASPRVWGEKTRQHTRIPRFFVMSDMVRLPDPSIIFEQLPRASAVILRHTDPEQLEKLAVDILPKAHARGLKVLISNDVRLAQRLNADGVHLSEAELNRGPWRRTLSGRKPNFLITAAVHNNTSAANSGIDACFVSPVFATQSHPDIQPIGIFRFATMLRSSPKRIIALGGITATNMRRLKQADVFGIAAIGAWLA